MKVLRLAIIASVAILLASQGCKKDEPAAKDAEAKAAKAEAPKNGEATEKAPEGPKPTAAPTSAAKSPSPAAPTADAP